MPDFIVNRQNIITPGAIEAGAGTIFFQQMAATPSATSPDPAGSSTLASGSTLMRFTPTAARASLDIAAGSFNGQLLIIENNQTVVADTLSISGAHVLLDASSDAIIVKAASCEMFVWDLALNSGAGLWVHVGPFAG